MTTCIAILALSMVAVEGAAAAGSISLAGRWRFRLDPGDQGMGEGWFEQSLPGAIQLPGTLTGQGIGDEIGTDTAWVGGIVDRSFFTAPEYAAYREPGQVKIPFWLQPEKYYAGAAWYQRDIEIPPDWASRRTVLFLERAHWETRLWVDGRLIGASPSLSTPHEYDLGRLTPGAHVADRAGGQPPHRGYRRELPRHQRSHPGQLERHRGPDRTAQHAPGVDRGNSGLPGLSRGPNSWPQ